MKNQGNGDRNGRRIIEAGFDDESIMYLRSEQAAKSETLTVPGIEITSGPFFY